MTGSNRRPTGCKPVALPTELTAPREPESETGIWLGKSGEKYRPWVEEYKPPASRGQNNTGCAEGIAGTEFEIEWTLVDCGLQCLAGLELRHIGGCNLNSLTRPRIAARGGFTVRNAKGSEANESNFRAS